MHSEYKAQVELLLDILPYVAKEKVFALKGGTAINMFVRDMPRLSIDIDLTYLSFEPRDVALKDITSTINSLKSVILNAFPKMRIEATGIQEGMKDKLLCALGNVKIKIEVNTTMRGFIKPPSLMQLSLAVQKEFKKFSAIQVISYGELFGGKICAALDRQHPRDLFDVYSLLEEEGITEEVKQGFIAALLSHNRAIHELLAPNFNDQTKAFKNQFSGMAFKPFSYVDFEETRKKLLKELHRILTDSDKQLLLSFKAGEPNWDLSNIEQLKNLPAVKWKLENINKIKRDNPKKHAVLLNRLKDVLG
jgi:predicted nucleotidyltransferase component of viral defense system